MRERFKLPLSQEDAVDVFLAAIRAEVDYCDRTYTENDQLIHQAHVVAQCLRGETDKFGLLLCGMCGNGKTTFIKAIQNVINKVSLPVDPYNPREKYGMQIHNARSLAMLCKNDYAEFQRISRLRMLAIDDLGTEPLEVFDYGNTMTPMVDLLLERYDKRLFTIISTNLLPDQIHGKYGERIMDRMTEMMQGVVFRNPTYRSM